MRRAGFTLIEVLVAIAVLAAVVSALALTQVSTLRVTRSSERRSEALQAATDTTNYLRQKILGDFGTYWNACADGSTNQLCYDDPGQYPDLPSLGTQETFRIVRGSDLGSTTTSLHSNEDAYAMDGLIGIAVDVTQPSHVHIVTFVSCMDQAPRPTIVNPAGCDGTWN